MYKRQVELLEKEEMSAKERGELVRKVRELQICSIRDLTGFINAVYDKVKLAPEERAHAFEAVSYTHLPRTPKSSESRKVEK